MIGGDANPLLRLARVSDTEIVDGGGAEDEVVIDAGPVGPAKLRQRVAHGALDSFGGGVRLARMVIKDAEAIALGEVVIKFYGLHVAVEDQRAHGEIVAGLLRGVGHGQQLDQSAGYGADAVGWDQCVRKRCTREVAGSVRGGASRVVDY